MLHMFSRKANGKIYVNILIGVFVAGYELPKFTENSEAISQVLRSGQCSPQTLHAQASGKAYIDSEFYIDQEHVYFTTTLRLSILQ